MEGIRFTSSEVQARKIFARLFPGTDLIPGIKALCQKHGVRSGSVTTMLGSLKKVSFVWAIPDSQNKSQVKYGAPKILEGPIELISGAGAIGTMKGGSELAVHLHATFSDPTSKIWGGHLIEEGNPVAVTVEIVIDAFDGLGLERDIDEETDMPLFSIAGQPVTRIE